MKLAIGSQQQDFVVSYNEPYLNDSKSFSRCHGFNTESDHPDFDERKMGIAVTTSYR